ncbi:MAG TPA: glycosyltransferase family 2 protein [Thermoanaerobaculia bacterium]|nr:glycosyltransferase family 2 protein [Thermoanaerobaculia bacterium]
MKNESCSIPELSVVLPAFNEEAVLPYSLAMAVSALEGLCRSWEIVVVDDGSIDGTPRVLAELAQNEPRIRVLTQKGNQGYGAALVRGFQSCRYNAIFYTDADAQFDLAELALAYPLLAEADLVTGWRCNRQDPWPRKLASAGFNLLQGLMLGVQVRDVDCAFKLFRRSFFERVHLTSRRFLIDAEIYARSQRAGLRLRQLPVTHFPRAAGRSTVRPTAVWRAVCDLCGLAVALRRQEQEARGAELTCES